MATTTETCYRHPGRETGVSCSSCGRPICPDCMTPTPVGMRCPECAKQRTKVRHMPSTSAAGGTTVTMTLIAINVIAFLASGSFGVDSGGSSSVFAHAALNGPAIHLDHQYYRLVTGGFLHAGFLHIAFNMYLLYVLGQMLEPALGSVRFALLYAVSLLAGSFGALWAEPLTNTVGASGAVFGLMGAAFLEMRARGIDPWQSGIGFLIVFNLGFSFVASNISVGGHIGGLVGGSLAALAMQYGDRMRNPWIGYAGAGLIGVASVIGAIAVAGNTSGIG